MLHSFQWSTVYPVGKGKGSILSHKNLRVLSRYLTYMFRLTYRTAIIRIGTENYTRVTPYVVLLLFAVRP